jgi:hypothetical protein
MRNLALNKITVAGYQVYVVPLLISVYSLTPQFFPILLYDALRADPFPLFHTACNLVSADVPIAANWQLAERLTL